MLFKKSSSGKLAVYRLKLFKFYFDSSLLFRGLTRPEEQFGVYCFSGHQGYGKTYAAVRWLRGWFLDSDFKIYANLKSLKNVNYEYYSSIDDIIQNRERNTFIIMDEIFRYIQVGSRNYRQNVDKLAKWLRQSRKLNRIVIFTAQQWLDLPIEIRRVCRRSIVLKPTIFGIRMAVWGDAENMTYNTDIGEYECPLIHVEFFKIRPEVAESYDTLEVIEDFA